MTQHKVIAEDSLSAMDEISRVLGKDAVILDTKKINGRYSTSKSNKIDDIMQKDRIKNRTEKIGFFEKTTIKLEMKQSETRIKKVTL